MPKGNKTKEQKMEDDLLDKLADKLNEDCEEQIVQKVARGKGKKAKKVDDSDGKPKAKKVDDSDGKPKAKRAPSAYNIFVKEHYKDEDVQKLEPKERLGAIAVLWREHKSKMSK